jgi:Domain of unknown function (DUF1966)
MKKEVMMVLSNTGSQGEKYAITIPMGKSSVNSTGTEFTDIISCNKIKIASTGDFVTIIVTGMPQVRPRPISIYDLGMVSIFIIGGNWIYLWSSSWK